MIDGFIMVPQMKNQTVEEIKKALRKSWSRETCVIFDESYPYYGQCAQTSIVINELFGGEIFKTKGWPNESGYGRHFYNFIDGVRCDFTAEQFSEIPGYTSELDYQDIMSSVEEALTETSHSQVSALRIAFRQALGAR